MFKLSDDYTILPQTGKYLVVLDNKSKFRHFFLDGVENYEMFFYNNGEPALDYMAEGTEPNKEDNSKSKGKKKPVCKFKIGFTELFASIITITLIAVMRPYLRPLKYNISDFKDISVKEAISMLEKSNKLPSGSKKVLEQSGFFETFLPYFNSSNLAKGNLQDSLNDMKLNFLSKEDIQKTSPMDDFENVIGFCCSIYPNEIFVREGLDLRTFIDVLSHEFIHICQCPGLEYNAIYEAMAEQLSLEFFPRAEMQSYSDEVKQLRKMMDLIGPEPFIEYYTTGKMDSIEKEFKPYLGEEGYKDFLKKLTKVRIPNKKFPWHDQRVKEEEQRIKDLDEILDGLAVKMGKEFVDYDEINLKGLTHFYYNKQPMIRNLLSGAGYDLKDAYDKGIIGFSLKDEDGRLYRTLNYDEAIKRHEEITEEKDYDLVVTYNPDGDSTWTWAESRFWVGFRQMPI